MGRVRRSSKAHGSSQVGSGGFRISRVVSGHPHSIQSARSDSTREKRWKFWMICYRAPCLNSGLVSVSFVLVSSSWTHIIHCGNSDNNLTCSDLQTLRLNIPASLPPTLFLVVIYHIHYRSSIYQFSTRALQAEKAGRLRTDGGDGRR